MSKPQELGPKRNGIGGLLAALLLLGMVFFLRPRQQQVEAVAPAVALREMGRDIAKEKCQTKAMTLLGEKTGVTRKVAFAFDMPPIFTDGAWEDSGSMETDEAEPSQRKSLGGYKCRITGTNVDDAVITVKLL